MASKREQAWDAIALREEREAVGRYVDLRLEILPPEGKTPLLVVGGRWDRVKRRYVGEAKTAVKIRVSPAQEEAAKFLAEWLRKHIEVRRLRAEGVTPDRALLQVFGDNPPTRYLLAGGRRSGKSHLASLFMVALALAIPGARVVAVSPRLEDTIELRDFVELHFSASPWRESKTGLVEFVNDSYLELRTAAGQHLKIGPCDFVLQNEAQEQDFTSHEQLTGNLIDRAGLCLAAANPPKKPSGAWVTEWWNEATTGNRPWAPAIRLDPLRNPHIPKTIWAQQRVALGPLRFRREYLGDFTAPMSAVVFDAYDENINRLEYIPVGWVDVTREVTELYFDRAASWIIGADFDKRAGCTWVGARFYLREPGAPLDQAVMVIECCGTRYVDERAMARALHQIRDRHGYLRFVPRDAVVVADASAATQNNERDQEKPTSWQYMENEGWQLIKPDPNLDKNPRVSDRFGVANYCLRYVDPVDGAEEREPLVYVHAESVEVIKSLREYPVNRQGLPIRTSDHAHPADAWTYPCWRRWGREAEVLQTIRSAQASSGVRLVPRPQPRLPG